MSASHSMKIPTEFSSHVKSFESMYFSKFKGRKLAWLFHMGKSVLLGHFSNRTVKKDLFVSNIQLAILLIFNTR